MFCANCGAEMNEDASFCTECGHRSGQPVAATTMNSEQVVMEPDDTSFIDDDVRTFVGVKHPFYQSKWERMKEKGNPSSWNFPAFFFSLLWLGYRKMYREVFFIALLFLVIDIVLYLFNYQYSATELIDPVDNSISIGMAAVVGLFGNYFYQNHTMKKVTAIRNQGLTGEVKQMELKRKGETSILGILFSILIMGIVYMVPTYFIPVHFDSVEMVKTGTFEQFPDQTLEELFDDFFEQGDWKELSTNSDGTVVAYSGQATIDNDDHDIQIEFYITEGSETFDIQRIVVDGEELSSGEMAGFLQYLFDPDQLQGDDAFKASGSPTVSYPS